MAGMGGQLAPERWSTCSGIYSDIYKEIKEFKLAEFMYKHAVAMEPNKLYAHFPLAKLYADCNNQAKAVKKAKEVLSMDAKVNDIAMEEI